MGAVIDHLREGQTVRVIRPFTIGTDVACQVGDTGVLHKIRLDWVTQEILIEWERANVREVLRINDAATDGPRNGRMRDYFEVIEPDPVVPVRSTVENANLRHTTPGSPSMPPPLPPPLPPAAPEMADPPKAYEPRRPEAKFAGKKPAAGASLEELRVACDCDPALHFTVLSSMGEIGVAACLGCGTVTCTRCVGDEGRYTGNAWHAYLVEDVPGDALAWLSQWPRTTDLAKNRIYWPTWPTWVRDEPIYFSARTRCRSREELSALEQKLARDAADQTPGERLRRAGFPTKPPPKSLPTQFSGFRDVWNTLQLTPDSPVSELIRAAQLGKPANAVAADTLVRRRDNEQLMLDALRSSDPAERIAGHEMALLQTNPAVQAKLGPVIIDILESLPMTPRQDMPDRIASWGRYDALLVLVQTLKISTPAMREALIKQQHRLIRHDHELIRGIRAVLDALDGKEAPRRDGFFPDSFM